MKSERTNHQAGLFAENAAALLLRLKGYRIVARRYKTPVGEIDLIALAPPLRWRHLDNAWRLDT